MNYFIGIDPGAAGGIAAVDSDGVLQTAQKMPVTPHDLHEAVYGLSSGTPCRAVMEHVWSIPGQGGAYAFGKVNGYAEMTLVAAGIPYDLVVPKKWQREMGVIYPKGSTDTEKKNITKRRAQQLFPNATITHATADAILIAEFCRRRHSKGA